MIIKNLTYATDKGKRSTQQDTFIHVFDERYGALLGVFDGHGGDEASKMCAKHIPSHFFECMPVYKNNAEQSLRDTLVNAANILKNYDSGTTVSLAYLPYNEDVVYTAVIGDSPIIIGNYKDYWVSPQHNVRSNIAERTAAQERGGFYNSGYIFRIFHREGLQLSRVLGDAGMGKVVSNVPETNSLKVHYGDFVLVGTDGLFDPGNENTEKAVSDIVKLIEEGADANMLVAHALSVPTGDNVTAILARF
jgi:serine/threonine protein phosphatase PrpC